MKRRRFLHVALAVAAVAALGFSAPALFGELSALAKPGSGPEYICTHCRIGADAAGKCPLCQAEMKKAGTYVCPSCDTTSDKPGKCPCGKDYVKTELAAHKCDGCGYWVSNETKGCPVCKARQENKTP